MSVETATSISQLDTTLPTSADMVSEGDDHIRLLKTVLKTQFPNFGTNAVTALAPDLNKVGTTQAQTDYSTSVASTAYVTDKVNNSISNSVVGGIVLSGATQWTAGNWTAGQCVWSPISYQTYRAKTTGTLSTDPSADSTNWAVLTSGVLTLVSVSGTSVTAVPGCHYLLTNGSATTVTLPSTIRAGDPPIAVTPLNGLQTNIVARNGNNLMGLAEDMTLDNQYMTVTLRPVSSSDWRLL